MKHCKDCKWWSTESDKNHRPCNNKKIKSGDMIADIITTEFDYGCKREAVITWEDFGCILFELK